VVALAAQPLEYLAFGLTSHSPRCVLCHASSGAKPLELGAILGETCDQVVELL
jgi:hypothetical protein